MSQSLTGPHSLARQHDRIMWRLLALSVVLWAVGVATVRLAAPLGLFDAALRAPLLAATVLLVWLTLRLVGRVAGTAIGVIEAVALVSAPALLLDGTVLTFVPGLYSAIEAQRRAAGAWLLFFAGTSLALAIWRAAKPHSLK